MIALPRGRGVEQAEQLQFLFRRQKRGLKRIPRNFAQMLIRETEIVLCQLIFAGECRAEQRRIVCIQRDHNSLIEIALNWMLSDRFADAGSQVAGQANLQRNLPVGKFFNEIGILPGSEAMADAFGVEIQRPPNRFRRRSLPSMSCEPQAIVFRVSVNAAEKLWWSFLLVPAYANADHMPVVIAHGKLEYLLCCFHAKMPGGVENPQQGNAEVACPARPPALQAFKDCREVLLSIQTDSNRDIDLGMKNIVLLQALHQAVGHQLVVVGSAQVGAYFFECHQEGLEIGVAIEAFRFADCGPVPVLLAQFV